jgi:hypothetical protein
MKTSHYVVVLLLAAACAVLTVALILMAHANQQLQLQTQTQQQQLNQGILGQQAQQISGGILQELADSAVSNAQVRILLEKHGYRLPSSRAPASATKLPEPDKTEPATTGENKP